MHAIDPDGTRDLVKAALEQGSKEVKVVAISCLGADPDDLAFLIEQASAKAQDVRSAAYHALTAVPKPDAVEVLRKAMAGKDYPLVSTAIERSKNPKLVDLLVAEIRAGVDAFLKLKDKKQASAMADRLTDLINSFPAVPHQAAEAPLIELFNRREELARVKGDAYSGSDIVESVIQQMASGSPASKQAIVKAQAEVPAEQLEYVFDAAREVLTPAQLYDTFAPYLTAKVDDKKKGRDPAWARREAIIDAIESHSHYYYWADDDEENPRTKLPEFDPRWLDLAVGTGRLDFVTALARAGHPGAQKFAKAEFDAALKKAKSPMDVRDQLNLLMRLEHPAATEAFFAAMAKRGKKTHFYHYWFTSLVPRLGKESIPRLEELVATFPDSEANYWLDAIQELRMKT